MRLLALVLFGVPFGYAIGISAMAGNPVAIGVAVPIMGLALFFAAVLVTSRAVAKPLPRKADPAKIARLERELGIEQSEQETHVWAFTETGDIRPAPPLDAQHCPRDEACVRAHPCRVCGADKGQACAPLHEWDRARHAAAHGAPWWGRKIGP